MSIGFTLGKFAPLHYGHQLVIDTAIAETEHVIVMIYDCPETTEVPLLVRAGWIQDLYPSVEVIQAWNGPTEVGDTPQIKQMHEEYILSILNGRKITHFFSSEFYGDHVSKALGAINRVVDEARLKFPISGTSLRANPYAYRNFISSRVYRDLVTNVVLLGAPSTGKSTLAEELAKEHDTVWMPEYGREYWEKHQDNRRLTLEQLVELAEGHLKREEVNLLDANKFLFTDTNAITTYLFSLYYHGKALSRLSELASLSHSRYDITFLCEEDIPYDNTWDRSGEVNRSIFQKQTIAELIQRKIPFYRLKGSTETRILDAKKVLKTIKKFNNFPDNFSDMVF